MKFLLKLLLLTSFASFSQVGGEGVYSFLNVPTSARQAALGGKALVMHDDVNQALWNPATINLEMNNQLGVNYLNYLVDIGYASTSFAHVINEKIGIIHGGVTYANYGEFIEADEFGVESGTFKAYDLAISAGYSYQIPGSDFYVGANVKVINSVIQNYSSFGFATDLGLLYSKESTPYKFTFVIRNLGTQITTFDGTKEQIPLEIMLGGSYRLENVPIKAYYTIDNLQKWNVAKPNPSNSKTDISGDVTEEEISFLDNTMRHFVLGAELFPEGAFNLRLGYNIRRAKELKLSEVRTFAGFSFGFGLKMKRLKFNYAFTKYHPAENTSTFSLLINFDGERK
ncbi:MAG: type IX secretion system protein PorQ [Flavobacteriaceae bacterium]|nr:type IX secretion system protein PorQ [Flavobacteriaceae bacterium]